MTLIVSAIYIETRFWCNLQRPQVHSPTANDVPRLSVNTLYPSTIPREMNPPIPAINKSRY